MKKWIKRILAALLILVLVCVLAFCGLYLGRFKTLASIRKVSAYEDGYNLYRMDIKYDYSLDDIIASGITNDQSMVDAIVKEALPLLPVSIKAPSFGCTAFTMQDTDGDIHMGRNYDFKDDTSAMLVYCTPKGGYRSVALAALNNISANTPDASTKQKLSALTAPFVCLDGMNEKGVSIAVLTLDSAPTRQSTGKPVISTTLAIRLVLDRAATTQEAVDLLKGYDMFASSGRDYHFYITDASGDGRVIEYDCDDPARGLVETKTEAVTNFFVMYKDKVLPNQKNGIYGHGRERYDAMEEVLDSNAGAITPDIAWQALQAASQEPNPKDVTSNTQWSILYDNTNCTATIALRRDWGNKTEIDLGDMTGF